MFSIVGRKMKIIQGDTGIFDIKIIDHDLVEGDIVYFTVKTDLNSDVTVIQKIVTEFKDNVASITLTSNDTNIEPGTYTYDIQCSLKDGRVDTVVVPSPFIVLGGVTSA